MERKKIEPLPWTVDKESHAYMRSKQEAARKKIAADENQAWFYEKLKKTGHKWTKQAQWGFRLFDFWCADLGVAIQVDGPNQDIKKNQHEDEYNFRRSGIIVLRVRQKNEKDARAALEFIKLSDKWRDRRISMGLFKSSKKDRRKWVTND